MSVYALILLWLGGALICVGNGAGLPHWIHLACRVGGAMIFAVIAISVMIATMIEDTHPRM